MNSTKVTSNLKLTSIILLKITYQNIQTSFGLSTARVRLLLFPKKNKRTITSLANRRVLKHEQQGHKTTRTRIIIREQFSGQMGG